MGSARGSLEGGDGCWWIYCNMCEFILSELKRMWWLAIRNSRNSDAGCPLNFAACELIFCLSVWSSEMFAWSLCYFGYCKNNHCHLRNGMARAHYRTQSIGCIFSGGYNIIQNQIIVFYFCLAGSSTFVSSDILYIPSVLKALDHQSLGSFVAFRWVFGSNEQHHHHRTIAEPKPHISPNEAMKIEAKKNGTILRKDEIEMILSNSVLFGKHHHFATNHFQAFLDLELAMGGTEW